MSKVTLPEFINEVGLHNAAKLFGTAVVTVYKYRSGERRPRPDMAQKIIKATNGRVTWEGIYQPPEGDAGA